VGGVKTKEEKVEENSVEDGEDIHHRDKNKRRSWVEKPFHLYQKGVRKKRERGPTKKKRTPLTGQKEGGNFLKKKKKFPVQGRVTL